MARKNEQRAWSNIPVLSGKAALNADVYIDWDILASLARKAATNRSGQSHDGPVRVVITKREPR